MVLFNLSVYFVSGCPVCVYCRFVEFFFFWRKRLVVLDFSLFCYYFFVCWCSDNWWIDYVKFFWPCCWELFAKYNSQITETMKVIFCEKPEVSRWAIIVEQARRFMFAGIVRSQFSLGYSLNLSVEQKQFFRGFYCPLMHHYHYLNNFCKITFLLPIDVSKQIYYFRYFYYWYYNKPSFCCNN